jgi:CheY-like chemotaxis protein
MPEGGVVTVRADNAFVGPEDNLLLSEGRYVHILIRDQGIGISEETLPKIFDPYFTTKKKGSGLGLASVYSIIMKHDGHVAVESKPGAGAAFHLYLPASERRFVIEAVPFERRAQGRVRGKALVMDDESIVIRTAREILGHLGYRVDSCEDGAVALNLYREAMESGTPYSVIFMDLTIPGGMGGKVAVEKLLEIDPDAKAVVMSGYSDDPILAKFREYGFSGVVMKPFTLEEVVEALRTLDENKTTESQG